MTQHKGHKATIREIVTGANPEPFQPRQKHPPPQIERKMFLMEIEVDITRLASVLDAIHHLLLEVKVKEVKVKVHKFNKESL